MADDELKRYLARPNLARQTPIIISAHSSSEVALSGPGKTVELLDGDFLRVKRILQETDGQILLPGWRYRRNL